MSFLHTLSVSIHLLAGTAALVVGLLALLFNQQPTKHKRYGRYFLRLLSIVVTTAAIGLLLFTTNSFLLMLTLLSGYVGYSGYRIIHLRQQRSSSFDAGAAASALVAGMLYWYWLQKYGGDWAPSVVYSTLVALVLVTTYDLVKHFWLHEKLKTWWFYEHIYKMISAFSAILSGFTGNVLPVAFKPYSQIGPSVICLWLIGYFIWRQRRQIKRNRVPND